MRPLQLAQQYMDILFSGNDLDALEAICSDDFKFQGPFYQYDSIKAYIKAMKEDSPEGFGYSLIKTFEDDRSACLIYNFSKPGISTPMTQLFEVKDQKISRSLLIFDTMPFIT